MKILILASLLLLSFSISAQQRYLDESFKLQDTQTHTYATKNGEALQLDVYMPSEDNLQERPVIIFMHGGGFSGGTPTSEAQFKFAESAAKRGYVAVQISYRLTRKGQSFGCDFEAEGKMQTFRLAAEDFLYAVNFMVSEQSCPKRF